MAELKIEAREWYFLVDFGPEEVPAIKKRYTSKLVYRPLSGTIKVIAGPDKAPRFSKVALRGPRVTKNGHGEGVVEDFYRVDEMPDWLKPHIELAVYMARIELDK